jgi:hypothetical protein
MTCCDALVSAFFSLFKTDKFVKNAVGKPGYLPSLMKTITSANGYSKNLCVPLLISFCGIALAFVTVATAEQMPTLDALATNIVRATMPTNHYNVDVVQINGATFTNIVAVKTNSSALSAQPTTRQSTYRLHYSHENGFRTEQLSQSKGTNASPVTPAATGNMRASINIPNFLDKIKSWPTHSVVNDVWDGTPCYKISASSTNASTVFWMDANSKCVLRVILYIKGSQYSENILKYRLDKEHGWLLTNVDMTFAADGSHIQLEYGDYDFSKP